jgi:RNA polymerase-binding transcription factor DksA
MASQRKTGADRSKAKKAVKKIATAARPKGPAKAAPPAAKARPVVTAKRSAPPAKAAPAKAVAAKAVVGKMVAKKGAVSAKPMPAKAGKAEPVKGGKGAVAKVLPGVAGKAGAKGVPVPLRPTGKGGKPIIRVVERAQPANVRPIGALPPEAVARATHRNPVVAPARASAPVRPTRELKQDSGAKGVTDQDYKEFEQRLIDERRKIMKEMGYLENTVLKVNQRDSSGDLSGYSFHMADVGTDAMEREKAFLFASSEGRLLMEIDEALRKVYAGEYGSCEVCEKPISRARLEAMPYVRLCLSCKEREEREGRAGGGPGTPGTP